MVSIKPGTTVTASPTDAGHALAIGDERIGRIRGSRFELSDLEAELRHTGERSELVTVAGVGTPVLRLDPAGRKATTLTTSGGRYRLARQRGVPLRRQWILRRGLEGPEVLRFTETPLGASVKVADGATPTGPELTALVAGTLVVALAIQAAPAAAA